MHLPLCRGKVTAEPGMSVLTNIWQEEMFSKGGIHYTLLYHMDRVAKTLFSGILV